MVNFVMRTDFHSKLLNEHTMKQFNSIGRFMTLLAAVCGGAFLSHAQLEVTEKGQVLVGNIEGENLNVDTSATLALLGPGQNGRGASIAFGDAQRTRIEEILLNGAPTNGILSFQSQIGFEGRCYDRILFHYSATTKAAPFVFTTEVLSRGFIVNSDMRLKSNVSEIGSSLMSLSSLTPVSYTYSDSQDDEISSELSRINAGETSDRERFGFIAQEVQKYFPQLVVEDPDGMLGVDYIGFIPLLVDAIKDLSATVEEQKRELSALRGDRLCAPSGLAEINVDACLLGQNSPNPFAHSTVITCTIPEGINAANLYIYNLQGAEVMVLTIADRGDVQVEVSSETLTPGMYIYALIADGTEVDSRRMIVTK